MDEARLPGENFQHLAGELAILGNQYQSGIHLASRGVKTHNLSVGGLVITTNKLLSPLG